MDGALDVAAGEEGQRVARVDGERAVLGLDPLPLVRGVVPDLERGDRLAEEQRPGAEVRVALAPEAADLEVLLGRELGVLHVPEVVLRAPTSCKRAVVEGKGGTKLGGGRRTSLLRSYRWMFVK